MKIGRNSLCPCGSKKKYKRCCLPADRGGVVNSVQEDLRSEIQRTLAERAKVEADRAQKYGQVRRIIATRHAGHMFVAVGSRLLHDARWNSFHDFLFTYVGAVFDQSWFTAELSKPLEIRHPIMQWYDALRQFGLKNDHTPGVLRKFESPPAVVSALLSFSYDLYILEHHGVLSPKLVKRLQHKDLFQGARYEAYIEAAFIRAGFMIELEDESDRSSSHCEFAATHSVTGKRYSVEAKSRHRPGILGQRGEPPPQSEIEADVNGLLMPALRKAAKHERIVFIDVNVPPSEVPLPNAAWFHKVASQVKRMVENPQGGPLPPAFIFLTNFPHHFIGSDGPLSGSAVIFSAIHKPEFDAPEGSILDPTVPQKAYPEIFQLYDSLLRHTKVPHEFI